MFIISLTYKVSLDKIDDELDNHVEYLKEEYALGHFQASGRKIPRTGGIILSKIKDRNELDRVIQKDPFYQKNLADYEIIEFVPSMTSDELKSILEK